MKGGSAEAALTKACDDWGLKKSVLNGLYVMSRKKFINVTVCCFQVGNHQNEQKQVNLSEMQHFYGFHDFCFGMAADIIKRSEDLRYCGETRYSFAANREILFNRKARKMKIWACENKVLESNLPNINDSVPEDWKLLHDGMLYDFLLSIYPFFSRDFTVTKLISFDEDFCVACITPTMGFCEYIKYLDFAQSGKGMENNNKAIVHKIKAFRVQLEPLDEEKGNKGPKWNEDNTPVAVDADIQRGTIIQGCVVNDYVRQMI